MNKIIDEKYIEDVLNTCATKKEFIAAMNIDIAHKSGTYIDEEILSYLNCIGNFCKEDITAKAFKQRCVERHIKSYLEHPNLCQNCGNIIPFERKDNKCCSTSCSRSIANKERGKRSDVTKQKISEGVKRANTAKLIDESDIVFKQTYYDRHYRICAVCGKTFERARRKNGRLSRATVCSEKCHLTMVSENGKRAYEKIKSEGRFQGWKSRNITSYPERFWIDVLTNNDIKFEREVFFNNKYFLDFVIKVNDTVIDLEIDGKQHKYKDRKQHDTERNKYLTDNNVIVYRIEWNSINTDKGKQIMKDKIDKFIQFYNSL